jgi:hypothetical protein
MEISKLIRFQIRRHFVSFGGRNSLFRSQETEREAAGVT